MKQVIQIRKAVEADLDSIGKLYEDICDYLETHRNYPGWRKGIYPVRSDAEEGLRENALYIAQIGQKTAGAFMLKHKPEEGYQKGKWLTEDDYEHICVLYTLAVHPDFQKQGIGTELLMYAERMARKEKCVSVRLDVVKDNVPAERLYAKCGYQLTGTVSLGYEAYGLPWYHLYEKVLKGYPSKEEAESILQEAEKCNPGPWGAHSRCVAECAEKIAAACGNMDVEKAYVLGLLHDIGRKFGTRHLGHVYDGWKYMEWLGYPEAGRICLTHSFTSRSLKLYIGKFDILPEQENEVRRALEELEYDDYDRLIQLCDAIGTAEGVTAMEERMEDIRSRYGTYPEEKWKQNLALRAAFERRIGDDLYHLLSVNTPTVS